MIGAEYYDRINKTEFKWNNYIIHTATFAAFINFVEISVIYLKGWKDFSFAYFPAGFIMKYLGFGIILVYMFEKIKR